MSESKQDDQSIFVSCRFRPINDTERHDEKAHDTQDDKYTIQISSNHKDVTIQRDLQNKSTKNDISTLKFSFDNILPPTSTQLQTFDTIGKPLINNVLDGYNATILTFGRTGSGKSYTMFGDANYSNLDEIGLIPRSLDYLFESLENKKTISSFNVTISIIEIYQEQLIDLLDINSNKKLEIFLSSKQLYIKNMLQKECKTCIDAIGAIIQALKHRHLNQQNLNQLMYSGDKNNGSFDRHIKCFSETQDEAESGMVFL